MASIDSLPADQRAVLELVLRRGRSYDDIAGLLSIDRAGVRQRALAAFDAIGPQTRIAADRRALITDYLLDALPDGVAQEVHGHLGASASERAWARSIASELQGLSDHPLPEIPSNGRVARPHPRNDPEHPPAATAAVADGRPGDRSPGLRAGSRVGGAIVLALAAVVALVLVLVFVVFPGGGKTHPGTAAHRSPASATSTNSTATTATSASSSAKVLARIQLRSPSGAASPVGVAELVKLGGRNGVAIVAQGLAPTRKNPPAYYAAWLYNSPSDAYFLGFAGAIGSNGRLETAGYAPNNPSHFHRLLLTLESRNHPKAPGHIVLAGNLTGA